MSPNQSVSPLVQAIREQIALTNDQMISFRDFMEYCLYMPDYGYYMSTKSKLGKKGDFYTSASIGGIVGERLACFIVAKMNEQNTYALNRFEIVEWGGGTGQLAKQIMDYMRREFPDAYSIVHYFMIEKSSFHCQLQREVLQEHEHVTSIVSQEEWMQRGSREHTFIFSNELLDSFPVHRIRCRHNKIYEIFVRWDNQTDTFAECEKICIEKEILNYLQENGIVLADGQTAEINLAAGKWINEVSSWMKQGDILTIDYGDVAAEVYSEHRMNGTLLCYRKHQAYDNPYIHIGEQDMTAHINFTACIRAGIASGIQSWQLQTQREFLVQTGVLDQLRDDDGRNPFSETARKNRAIRQLLLSDQMSELFKVLLQTKT